MNPNVLSFEKATKFYFFGKKIYKTNTLKNKTLQKKITSKSNLC